MVVINGFYEYHSVYLCFFPFLNKSKSINKEFFELYLFYCIIIIIIVYSIVCFEKCATNLDSNILQ